MDAGSASAAGLQHFGDEERIAGGQPVEFSCVNLCALCQCCDAGRLRAVEG